MKIDRNVGSGRFTTMEKARKHCSTHIVETIKRKRK
jgi:hypothetical protein